MKLNEYNTVIIAAIIAFLSAVIVAIITVYFNHRSNKRLQKNILESNKKIEENRNYIEFITNERIRQIEDIREKYSELMMILTKYKLTENDENKLYYLINYLKSNISVTNGLYDSIFSLLQNIDRNWQVFIDWFNELRNKNDSGSLKEKIIEFNYKLDKDFIVPLELCFKVFFKYEFEIIKEEVKNGRELLENEKNKLIDNIYNDGELKKIVEINENNLNITKEYLDWYSSLFK